MSVNRFEAFVLALCLFGLPMFARAQDVALRDNIDQEIKTGWAEEKITPPAKAVDSVFLRRIYLDLVGMIPTYEETTAFLTLLLQYHIGWPTHR